MEAWGAEALVMALESGIVGAGLILAVLVLRPGPRWSAAILLLGLVHFLVPPLVTVQGIGPTFIVSPASGTGAEGVPSVLAVLAMAQWTGLAVGALVLARSLGILALTLRGAVRVEEGPAWELLLRTARDQGIPTPRLYLAPGVAPAAVGILRPTVLLPREIEGRLSPDALRLILAHEVAHLARRDPLVAPFRLVVTSLWWFHPVAWLLARLHRKAAEDACDDAAVRQADAGPGAYCAALLAAAARRTRGAPALHMAHGLGGHPLGRRFRRLLRPRAGPRVGGWLLAPLVVLALASLPLGFLTPHPASGGWGRLVVPEEIVIRSEIVIRHESVIRHGGD